MGTMSTGEWITAISASVAAVCGTGLVSQIVLGTNALKKMRNEKAEVPLRERTVAAEEAETAVRVMSATINNLRSDRDDYRTRLEGCEHWRVDHMRVCPMGKLGRSGRG